jgi:hypothetical protein
MRDGNLIEPRAAAELSALFPSFPRLNFRPT